MPRYVDAFMLVCYFEVYNFMALRRVVRVGILAAKTKLHPGCFSGLPMLGSLQKTGVLYTCTNIDHASYKQ